MNRTQLLQETRKMHFEDILSIWTERRLTQEEAARLLGVCERTFRRYIDRYNEGGLDALMDKRLMQASTCKASVDEVMKLVGRYTSKHQGWNVKHFHSWYRREGGTRSYTWVKNQLQEAHAVPRGKKRGVHRKKRDAHHCPA